MPIKELYSEIIKSPRLGGLDKSIYNYGKKLLMTLIYIAFSNKNSTSVKSKKWLCGCGIFILSIALQDSFN